MRAKEWEKFWKKLLDHAKTRGDNIKPGKLKEWLEYELWSWNLSHYEKTVFHELKGVEKGRK